MNMAELRYLQDAVSDSLTFWREFRDQYVAVLTLHSQSVPAATICFHPEIPLLVHTWQLF